MFVTAVLASTLLAMPWSLDATARLTAEVGAVFEEQLTFVLLANGSSIHTARASSDHLVDRIDAARDQLVRFALAPAPAPRRGPTSCAPDQWGVLVVHHASSPLRTAA